MKNNKKGFTLAELLIVIAIMAILIAIAIPVFSSQLENAREAVDRQTARSASSLAYAEYMLNHSTSAEAITYTFEEDDMKNLVIKEHTASSPLSDADDYKGTGDVKGKSKVVQGLSDPTLKVIVTNGEITSNTWLATTALGIE